MNIGILIRKGRKQKSWNQTELAKRMGVHQTHVSQWENGEKRIYGDDLIKIARLLDIVEEIFPEYQEMEKESDTRRFVRERLFKMEEDLSSQIKLLEQRMHERAQQKLDSHHIFLISNDSLTHSLIKETVDTLSLSAQIVIQKPEEANMVIKKYSVPISLVIIDFVPSIESNILKAAKVISKKQIPCIFLLEKVTSKILKKFCPGNVSVVKKPIEKDKLCDAVSKINLNWYYKML